jgi:tRNA A37 threonylcarbamoyladenosine synthetase subunit TsaC/SUA5/YrdC
MGEVCPAVEKDLKMMVKATWKGSYTVILKVKCHKKDQLQVKN